MIKNKIKVTLFGLNQNHFLQECQKHKIAIKNYVQKSRAQSSFIVSDANYKKLKSLGLFDRYSVKSKPISGLKFWLLKLPQQIGLLSGLLLSVMFTIFSSQKVLKINIVAPNDQTKSEIIGVLKSNNISIGTNWNSIDTSKIESTIFNSIKTTSNVSAKKDGSCLIISTGALSATAIRTYPIIAPEDCTIESIEVARGVANFEAGDLVQKGEIIVSPNQNGQIIASVKIRVYHQSSVAVSQFLHALVRSGSSAQKTKIIWPFQSQDFNFPCAYEQFEKETITTNCFSNFLLPIKKVTVIYHELKPAIISEAKATEQAKAKAKSLIEKEIKNIDKISYKEREQNGQKFVDCFAEAVLEL